MAGVVGADAAQLRTTAKHLTQAADRLGGAQKGLTSLIVNASFWRGPDSDRFRSEWRGQSVPSITRVVDALHSAADALQRNAAEQEKASSAGTGSTSTAVGNAGGPSQKSDPAPESTRQLWNTLHGFNDKGEHESGYHVQKVISDDGTVHYIVYISGTDEAEGQNTVANLRSAEGKLDEKAVQALKRLIKPPDAEVMLVGYSQGGMDAQNIAHQKLFNVTQIVTFGSPVRNDVDIPSVHMRAVGDLVPDSPALLPIGEAVGAAGHGAEIGGKVGSALGEPGKQIGRGMGSVLGFITGGIQGEVNAVTSPYAPTNNLVPNSNYGTFTAPVDVDNRWDPFAYHASYDQVADQYDQAVAKSGVPPQGAHMADFQGTVTDDVDIRTDGSGAW